MKCSDIQFDLAVYSDGLLPASVDAAVQDHLSSCPVCREAHAEHLELQTGLRHLSRADIPAGLRHSLRSAVARERHHQYFGWMAPMPGVREWLSRRLMPFAVGVVASLFIGAAFLAALPHGIRQEPGRATDATLLANASRFDDIDPFGVNPAAYARGRSDIASESPSINPKGALVALTKSLVRGSMKDDEVVVVAEVFGNGLAQITEVVEPTRDKRAVAELAKALDSDPTYAPFVPAAMDNRSDSVKVILRFQSVSVSVGNRKRPH
jgi:hypothetical protein